jgi:hypothetical protein
VEAKAVDGNAGKAPAASVAAEARRKSRRLLKKFLERIGVLENA